MSMDDPDTNDAMVTPPPRSRRLLVAHRVLWAVIAACVVALLIVPVPYVIEEPGPTLNTLGSQDGKELVTVHGAKTYPASGELLMTTVSSMGGPGYPATSQAVISAVIDPNKSVVPREAVYAPHTTEKAAAEQNSAQMISSQDQAAAAALYELGYQADMTVVVYSVTGDGPSDGKLKPGDTLTAINGTAITDVNQLKDELAQLPAGSAVTIDYTRDKAAGSTTITTGKASDGSSLLGVTLSDVPVFPVTVSYGVQDIGGPSAGMMFALSIIDKMTPEDELGGTIVAGTGTIDMDGNVGPIGGIAQKMAGAAGAGAHWFIAPAANCADVAGHIPAGMTVVSVSTLHQAHELMIAIGNGTQPKQSSCPVTN